LFNWKPQPGFQPAGREDHAVDAERSSFRNPASTFAAGGVTGVISAVTGYLLTATGMPPSTTVIHPDDSSIVAVSIAASAAAFSALFVLFIGVRFFAGFATVRSDAIAVTRRGGTVF
jgi:hypothetical protein